MGQDPPNQHIIGQKKNFLRTNTPSYFVMASATEKKNGLYHQNAKAEN
jgi:hypothetical protein